MNANTQQPGRRRLVVGSGSTEGRVYVVDAAGDHLKLTQAPQEARRFEDPEEAQQLVEALKSHPHGREPHWTVFDLDRSEAGEPASGAELQEGDDLGTPGQAGKLAGSDALGGRHGDMGRGAD